MATNVATLTAKLTADTRQLKTGLQGAGRDVDKFQKKTTGATSKAKAGFGGVGKAAAGLGIAFGATKLVSFLGDAVGAFSDLEESVNAVTVIYEDQSDVIAQLGENSAEAFGLTTTEVNDAAVAMGAFADKIDEADPADAFKNVLQRATDFASVMNIDTAEALDKFRSGLAGESEPLKKFGLDLSEATVQQVALAEGIIATGETMTQTEKVQARYLTIMKQTEKTAGDFANTADGLANSQKILSAKWEEAQIKLGQKLAPAMTTLLQAGVDLLPVFGLIVDVFGSMLEAAQPSIDLLGELAGILGDVSAAAGEGEEAASGLGIEFGVVKDAVLAVIDPLGPFREGMAGVALEMLGVSDESDELATGWENVGKRALELNESMKTLSGSSVDLGNRWEDLDPKTLELNERMKVLGGSFKTTNTRIGTVIRTLKEVREAFRRLVSPVFNAEQATDEFNETLARVEENGVVTREEAEELAEAFGNMQAAVDAVGPENIIAAEQQIGEALGRLQEDTKVTGGSFDTLAETAFDAFDRIIQRAGGLEISAPLPIEIEFTVPSQAEIRAAMIRELDRLRREGILPAVGF